MKKGTQLIPTPINQKFGRLTIISDAKPSQPLTKGGRSQRQVICLCDCGKEVVIKLNSIKRGHTKSCGCLHGIDRKGRSHEKIFKLWKRIIYRCYNESYPNHHRYGGRGIVVSDEWLNSFDKFEQHCLECGYDPNLTIDRINNDGNYEYGNIRFVTTAENNLNRVITEAQNNANTNKASKPVMCLETKEVFKSKAKAAKHVNCTKAGIRASIKRGIRCKGFHWIEVITNEEI